MQLWYSYIIEPKPIEDIRRRDRVAVSCPDCKDVREIQVGDLKRSLARYGVSRCRGCSRKTSELNRRLLANKNVAWGDYIKECPAEVMQADMVDASCGSCGKVTSILAHGLKRIVEKRSKYLCRSCVYKEVALSALKNRKLTNKKLFGTEFPSSLDHFKDKTKQTNLSKFGVETPAQNPEIQEKLRARFLEKYGTTSGKLHGKILDQNEVGSTEELENKVIAYLEETGRTSHCTKTQKNLHMSPTSILKILHKNGRGDLIHHEGQKSVGELELKHFIDNVLGNKSLTVSGDRGLLKSREVDILIPSHNLGVEYNGNIWHSSRFRPDPKYHISKREECEGLGVRLIQIRSDEWENRPTIVKSIIKNALGKNSQKYQARKLYIKVPNSDIAQGFLSDNHLMGPHRSSRPIGLYTKEDVLVQLITYKLLAGVELELSRVCGLVDTVVIGGVSKLISAILKLHPNITHVKSFVDLRYATGNSLTKLGFLKVSTTLGWRWTNGVDTYNRLQCRANMDERKLTQAQHAEELGLYKLYDAGQAKFVKTL